MTRSGFENAVATSALVGVDANWRHVVVVENNVGQDAGVRRVFDTTAHKEDEEDRQKAAVAGRDDNDNRKIIDLAKATFILNFEKMSRCSR